MDGDGHRDERAAAAAAVDGGHVVGGGLRHVDAGGVVHGGVALVVAVPGQGGAVAVAGGGEGDGGRSAVGDGRGGQLIIVAVDGGGDTGTCRGASLSVLRTHVVGGGGTHARGIGGTRMEDFVGVLREIPVISEVVVGVVDGEVDLAVTATCATREGWCSWRGRYRDCHLGVAGTAVQRSGDGVGAACRDGKRGIGGVVIPLVGGARRVAGGGQRGAVARTEGRVARDGYRRGLVDGDGVGGGAGATIGVGAYNGVCSSRHSDGKRGVGGLVVPRIGDGTVGGQRRVVGATGCRRATNGHRGQWVDRYVGRGRCCTAIAVGARHGVVARLGNRDGIGRCGAV